MFRKLFLTFLAAFCVIFAACTKKSDSSESKGPKTRLGFVIATMKQERYAKDKAYFEAHAQKLGADVEFASCDDKVNVQMSKVETLLSKGIDVLVIQPVNGKAASAIVELAKKDKVPVVAYDRIINNADLDVYVTQDSFRVGVLQAEEAVARTGGKGNYIILSGEAGHSVADAITRGNLSVLAKYPNIKVIVKQNHPLWSTSLALATVENALTRYQNKVDAILANNDGMALGATQALEEQGLTGKVFVAGADADLAAIKDIIKGKQTMTVLKGIRPLAETAVEVAVRIARGENFKADTTTFNGFKEVPTVNTPVFRVVKDNIDSQVVDYGFHTRQSVYGAE
ncbi:MAG: substrate-binding domain-containing protein [Bdellovibrionaceae bacterium]|nr:substrate-binding domain-containing protein [Bdellovibrionales bacterium]MCB9253925.1 substrate-binding domain-containing protein [Pseudobdellovibrionaceae bacterium]